MIVLSSIAVGFGLYVAHRVSGRNQHREAMMKFDHRIHINGIRGKSSVTRLVAAALREGGIKTAAKTTGSAARILIDHENETPIKRHEPDIAEQRKMLAFYTGDMHRMYTGEDYKAVVFECMAVNPIYQRYLEEKVMYANIAVITNVREDHVDQLGDTLPKIARSLCNMVPKNGHLVTAETEPEILAILQEECDKRSTQLHAVGNMKIADKHMAKFRHFEYKPNVAIGIKVAQLCGIDRKTAIAGMHKAQPDPGAFVLKTYERKKKTIHWANLFAINDRESFVFTAKELCNKVGKQTKRAVILNNRHDRAERVSQFIDIAINEVKTDYIITMGDYEQQVAKEVKKLNPEVKVIHLGNSSDYRDAKGDVLFDKIAEGFEHENVILFGAVNIHTQQSQQLLTTFGESYAH